MPRIAVALSCTAETMAELERLSRSRSGEVRMAERARIVLACLRGKRNDEIAREMSLRPNTVGQWRKRFAARGLAGLQDAPRSGKPPKYGVELRDRILAQLELAPPAGRVSWDGASLAAALGVSDDAVWRVLRKQGIQLQRHRSWCVSTDQEFAAKAADVIGLYLNPPQNALVLSVDEKPLIQALERACGYVQTSSGKIVQQCCLNPAISRALSAQLISSTGSRLAIFLGTRPPRAVARSLQAGPAPNRRRPGLAALGSVVLASCSSFSGWLTDFTNFRLVRLVPLLCSLIEVRAIYPEGCSSNQA